MSSSTDRIERRVLINGPIDRVWRAISDAAEFGSWFGVDFKGETFVPGKRVQGRITYPGYNHLTMDVLVESVVPQRSLSFRWHPAALDPTVDYSTEPTTLVVFELDEVQGGTMLSLVESGLDQIPIERRATVFRLNSQGWEEQIENIQKHVAKA